MKEEKLEFENKGEKIFGFLHIPNSENPPAIIMVHGLGGYAFNEPFKDVAKQLCKNGFEVLRFAFRGYDGNGSLKDVSISEEIPVLKAAIDFIEKQKTKKIGLITESFGGTIAILLNDSRIKSMLLLAPTINLKETLSPPIFKELFGEKFFEEINKINKIKESQIKAVKCPMMIVHGSNDEEVNPKQSKELFNMANQPKKLVLIDGAKHMLTRNPSLRNKVIQLSLDWFNKWLR